MPLLRSEIPKEQKKVLPGISGFEFVVAVIDGGKSSGAPWQYCHNAPEAPARPPWLAFSTTAPLICSRNFLKNQKKGVAALFSAVSAIICGLCVPQSSRRQNAS
jgi:hypothetical protein